MDEPDETRPLLNRERQRQEHLQARTEPGKLYSGLFFFFYSLCTITGQLPITVSRDRDGQPGERAREREGEGARVGREGEEAREGEGGEAREDEGEEARDGEGGEARDGEGGEARDVKGGEARDGEGGEARDGEGGDGERGEARDGEGGEARDGERGKARDGKGGDGERGEARDGEGGEARDGEGEGARGLEGNRQKQTKSCRYLFVFVNFFLVGLFTSVNLCSLGFDLYVIIHCPYKYCGYISVPIVPHHVNASGLQSVQPVNLAIFDDWQKTVITTATLSGTVSYLFMVYVLYSLYSVLKTACCEPIKRRVEDMWERCGQEKREQEQGPRIIKSPFEDKNDTPRENISTLLSPKQATYFMFIFLLNMLVFSGNVATLFVIFSQSVDKKKKRDEIIDGVGLTSQFVSQLCAILSCFIFSKLAYSVSSTCTHELLKLYRSVDRAQALDNNDPNITELKEGGYITEADVNKNSELHLLKAIANWYTRLVHSTLHPFGTWFAVHWVLYTVTAFMSISYLAETIILELYGHEKADIKCHGEHNQGCQLKLAYTFLFAVDHCILFLYPCFRAASVTTAYTSMIKKVSKENWERISLDDKEKFINYLKLQDCTFKISILCAKLSFGFYIAYFSIFLGLFGVILKLAL